MPNAGNILQLFNHFIALSSRELSNNCTPFSFPPLRYIIHICLYAVVLILDANDFQVLTLLNPL